MIKTTHRNNNAIKTLKFGRGCVRMKAFIDSRDKSLNIGLSPSVKDVVVRTEEVNQDLDDFLNNSMQVQFNFKNVKAINHFIDTLKGMRNHFIDESRKDLMLQLETLPERELLGVFE